MVTESPTPKFTAPSVRIWNAISPADQQTLVSRSWCGKCRQEVTISDYSGSVKAGHVLLLGTCSACGGSAYRFVEATEGEDGIFTVVAGEPRLTSADAANECTLAKREANQVMKRFSQLQRKSKNGIIEDVEQRELDWIAEKGLSELTDKLMRKADLLFQSFDR